VRRAHGGDTGTALVNLQPSNLADARRHGAGQHLLLPVCRSWIREHSGLPMIAGWHYGICQSVVTRPVVRLEWFEKPDQTAFLVRFHRIGCPGILLKVRFADS
jgi:hypothetical protein